MPAYHDLDPDQATISNATPKEWKVFNLWAMDERAEPERRNARGRPRCWPRSRTSSQVFFSILEPREIDSGARGAVRAYLRYYLGLKVPDEAPPSIRVKDEWHTWQENESVLFDDSWNHEVVNDSTGERIVLIVDVLRPMPLPLSVVNKGVALAARYVYGRKVLERAAQAREQPAEPTA
ncbi:aspartyl/asparaginyl beta-hydroxylase (cupin superfamily) [Kibdelosporangium phytohabitans]|nr:aspartyl/asparaginyl beta-hydroxylase (cupin superfamily) [Kibdelosporangium phytohabitans]